MPRQRRTSAAVPSISRRKYVPPPEDAIRRLTAAELLDGARPLLPEKMQLDFAEMAMHAPVWCVGDTSLVKRPSVAIVGTREVSADGAARARRLARELAGHGVVVVSGLARGVDTEALKSAIEAGGSVVAVIGTPLDKAYPAENKGLQETIHARHLLVTQTPVGGPVFPSNFPLRNRLMALMTDATVIIEASDTSGTLHQAAECQRLGRWLFIAKNVMDDDTLAWPRRFTSDERTRTLTSTSDILDALDLR